MPASFSSTRIVVAATKELAGFTTSPDWRAASNASKPCSAMAATIPSGIAIENPILSWMKRPPSSRP